MELGYFEIILRIFVIYLLIISGYMIRLGLKDPESSSLINVITKMILNIFFPFLVFSAILNADITSGISIIITILYCLVIIFSGMFILFLYARKKSIPRTTLGSIYLVIGFPNSVFLPFPLIILLIGVDGLVSATIFAVTIIIVQNSLGSYIGIKYGNIDSKTIPKYALVKKIILFPPAFVMIIAFIFKIIYQPKSFVGLLSILPINQELISVGISVISWLSLIFALLLVGISFNIQNEFRKSYSINITTIAIIRLILAPLIGTIFLGLSYIILQNNSIFSKEIVIPIIIQSFAGPAIINIAFSKQYELDVGITSFFITVLTLISLLMLLPIMFILLSIF